MTAVFDTNVVVAALITRGLCHEALNRAIAGRLLASSPALLDEADRTLRDKFTVTSRVAQFLAAFRGRVRLVEPVVLTKRVCRDADDDLVLGTAVAAEADVIVTGDQDLLVIDPYGRIRIITPRAFIAMLESA